MPRAQSSFSDLLRAVIPPGTSQAVAAVAHRQHCKWLTSNLWSIRTFDGAILGGVALALTPVRAAHYRGLLSGLEGVTGKKAVDSDAMTVKN